MKSFLAACILMTFVFSMVIHAFDINPPGWAGGSASFHTTVLSNSGSGLSDAQLTNAFSEALEAWSNVSIFEYQTISGSADPCAGPSANANGFTFSENACNDENGQPIEFSPSTLAVAITWRSRNSITQSGIVFNSQINWDIYSGPRMFNPNIDFTRVAVHELGHSLGLGHSDTNSAIMFPFVGTIETPQNDDLNGVGALYGLYDTDGDGVAQHLDNCLTISNANQEDTDGDGVGNACEGDEICLPIRAKNNSFAVICL